MNKGQLANENEPLRVLLLTSVFYPQIGGVETVSTLLAREFDRAGAMVKVATLTRARGAELGFCTVLRRVTPQSLLRMFLWAHVIVIMGETLRLGWPALLFRKRTALAHHLIYEVPRATRTVSQKLRRLLRNRCANVVPSQAIGNSLDVSSVVVGNPYDDEVFKLRKETKKCEDLVFVGRLVREKGADLLLRALGSLSGEGIKPKLTLIGSGPEEGRLKAMVARLGLEPRVRFLGPLRGEVLAQELNRHRVLIVPSQCMEAFGLVVLEGIACGCRVVGSSGGGLPEAIGPCGSTFPNGDCRALCDRLWEELTGNQVSPERANAHLARFRPSAVAQRYLNVLKSPANLRRACACGS